MEMGISDTKKMSKKELRTHYLAVRKSMDPAVCRSKSKSIHDHFLQSEVLSSAQVIHMYLSIPGQNEVDTTLLLPRLFSLGKTVAVPCIRPGHQLIHKIVSNNTTFKTGKWGVSEPLNGDVVQPDDLDIVLVPMVAGDCKHQRLGYGKGFYDRFLEKTKAVHIGFLFDASLHPEPFPVEEHDHPLDYFITESGFC